MIPKELALIRTEEIVDVGMRAYSLINSAKAASLWPIADIGPIAGTNGETLKAPAVVPSLMSVRVYDEKTADSPAASMVPAGTGTTAKASSPG